MYNKCKLIYRITFWPCAVNRVYTSEQNAQCLNWMASNLIRERGIHKMEIPVGGYYNRLQEAAQHSFFNSSISSVWIQNALLFNSNLSAFPPLLGVIVTTISISVCMLGKCTRVHWKFYNVWKFNHSHMGNNLVM